uniref:Uncharacterized protein n=1 Tax=Arundo donax TaxID=35708 RepID=A0A0A9G3B7_ARUDO
MRSLFIAVNFLFTAWSLDDSFRCLSRHLRFWNQTLICLGSMFARMGHSRSSCCRRAELGLGHSAYTRSSASTCSGVYRTYLPVSSPPLSYPPPPSLLPLCIATAAAILARPPTTTKRKSSKTQASYASCNHFPFTLAKARTPKLFQFHLLAEIKTCEISSKYDCVRADLASGRKARKGGSFWLEAEEEKRAAAAEAEHANAAD